MQLTLDGITPTFISLADFRVQWGLPDEFALVLFEPKDWDVGSMDGSGRAMTALRQHVIAGVPAQVSLTELLPRVEALVNLFEREMLAINTQIGLREVEVDFAVAGFADVMRGAAYQLIQLGQECRGNLAEVRRRFDFGVVYQGWLDASARLAGKTYAYTSQNRHFEIQTIYNPYGRVGLKIRVENEDYYVTDLTLACPAASFMQGLCYGVAQGLAEALVLSV